MADKSWKAWERTVARIFGGTRRGADTRGPDGGKSDVIHEHYSIECKLLGAPGYADMLAAARQSEINAGPNQEPVAVIKRKNKSVKDALVVQRLETYTAWRLGTDPIDD